MLSATVVLVASCTVKLTEPVQYELRTHPPTNKSSCSVSNGKYAVKFPPLK